MSENIIQPNPEKKHFINATDDYKNGLIIGILIGLAVIPSEKNLGLAVKYPYIYVASIILLPIISIIGLFVGKTLFYRVQTLWQFTKFGLVGVSNTVINFGIVNLLVFLTNITRGLGVSAFAALAFIGALVNSYFWNSHWSFKNKNPRTPKEFITFTIVTFIGLLINSTVVYLVVNAQHAASISPKLWVNVANLAATLVTMFWNFSGFKFIVFKEKK